ncbi:MAG: 2-amino-4-hydroxy-6-hydroxymethyldihydropteridine diphosphokinase [Pseudomonadota bacterium]
MIDPTDEMILIAAGSSLPFNHIDSQQIVLSAFFALGRLMKIDAVSALYETPAWPDPSDPSFVNAVAAVSTRMPAQALLQALHAIEAGFGRRRDTPRNAPRTLDLDLVAYGRECRHEKTGVLLPHPRLQEREFVLAPLCDIAPDWRHPILGKTAAEMLAALPDQNALRIG